MAKLKPKGKKRPNRQLTGKQQAFIHWYVSAEVNLNATEACRRAGYKGSDTAMRVMGSKLLANASVRREVDARIKQAMKGGDVTIEGTLRKVTVIGDKALAAGQYAPAAKCAELHGKYLKMWTERIEHVQTIEDVSTEELVRLMKEIAENGGIDLMRIIAGDGAKDGSLPMLAGNTTAH